MGLKTVLHMEYRTHRWEKSMGRPNRYKVALMYDAGARTAKDLPKNVERYVQEGKDQGLDEGEAWAVAWSRYCKYKEPGSPHCKKDSPSDYFPGKKVAWKYGRPFVLEELHTMEWTIGYLHFTRTSEARLVKAFANLLGRKLRSLYGDEFRVFVTGRTVEIKGHREKHTSFGLWPKPFLKAIREAGDAVARQAGVEEWIGKGAESWFSGITS